VDPRWATLDTIGGKTVLRFERRLAHPPEKVFRAISEPAELAHWFPARMEAELRPGAPIRFTFEEDDAEAPAGEILEVDPPKLLVYTWGDDVLRWEIVPAGDGCRLLFSQTIAEDGLSGGRAGAARNAAGWDVCLARLSARLDGEACGGPEWFPLFEGYVERFGLGEGIAEQSGDGFVLRFERDVVHPPADVWRLLTEGAEQSVGAEPARRLWHDRAAPGRVLAVEPGRLLEYDAEPAGRVRWELRLRFPGSLIVVTQTLPAAHAALRPAALAAWQVHLELLVAALQGSERCWPEERVTALEARYAARLGVPARTAGRP
jgi:uncharacterized protein YndB with AHSA1/START domain